MKVLELCCGLKGWSNIWVKYGHKVETLDINSKFNPTYCLDILDFNIKKEYDIIFASPPCTYFSKIRNVWNNTKLKTTKEQIQNSIAIAQKCFDIIKESKCKYYLVENPHAGMSKYFPGYETIDYCEYKYYSDFFDYNTNKFFMIKKRTDIWTNINFNKRLCSNKHKHIGLVECKRKSEDRSKIPYYLSKEIYDYIIQLEAD